VAGYLTFVETQQVAAICGPVGDCNAVQSSPYATLFGFMPMGLLGILGYLAILSAGQLHGSARVGFRIWQRLLPLPCRYSGFCFRSNLTYLELAVILAVCMWCLTSALIMAALLILNTGSAVARLLPDEETDF